MKATRIQLCGMLAVESEGRRREDELPGRQGRLLFIYLVVNRARPVARRELLDVLWPDEPPHTAETTLTGVLSRLRHVLDENGGAHSARYRRARSSASARRDSGSEERRSPPPNAPGGRSSRLSRTARAATGF